MNTLRLGKDIKTKTREDEFTREIPQKVFIDFLDRCKERGGQQLADSVLQSLVDGQEVTEALRHVACSHRSS